MVDKNSWVHQEDPSPFHYAGNGDIGVLLLHGFGGTPREMSRLGQYLHKRDITVYAPLLPGHGSSLEDMNRHSWHDWAAETYQAFSVLEQSCNTVFIAGFSMGTLLALWLAINGADNGGLILYSPAIKVADWRIALTPLVRHFVKSIPNTGLSDLKDSTAEQLLGGYSRYPVCAAAELYKLQRYVSVHMHRISTPVCVVYSVLDQSLHPLSGLTTVQKLSKVVPVETMVLYGSGHAIIVDVEWVHVAQQTLKFIQKQRRDNK